VVRCMLRYVVELSSRSESQLLIVIVGVLSVVGMCGIDFLISVRFLKKIRIRFVRVWFG